MGEELIQRWGGPLWMRLMLDVKWQRSERRPPRKDNSMSSGNKSRAKREDGLASSEAYIEHISRLVLRYGKERGLRDTDAFKELMGVTGRGFSTVKNWLRYRTGLPDLEAMARIQAHWRIPADEIFRADLIGLGSPDTGGGTVSATGLSTRGDVAVLALSSLGQTDLRSRMLQRYGSAVSNMVLLAQEGADASGVVEAGDLMLVDTSVDRIRRAGLYVLCMADGTEAGQVCTRQVTPLMGRPVARVAITSQALGILPEELPLDNNGRFESDSVSVLGRVVGVMRAL